jgi:DNA-binding response OmpR family regulator
MSVTVLVVEDEPQIQELVAVNLEHSGHKVLRASSAEEAQAAIRAELPDVLVLDWMLPGESGIALARKLRSDERTRELPILVLTARAMEQDKITGLEAGADDYLTKPFALAELVARVQALGRRTRPALPPVLRRDGVELNVSRHQVLRDDRYIGLSRKEFAVLEVLMRAEGAVVSAEELLEQAWDEHIDPFTNAVRVTIMTLRKKLGQPAVIHTVPGVGYQMGGTASP